MNLFIRVQKIDRELGKTTALVTYRIAPTREALDGGLGMLEFGINIDGDLPPLGAEATITLG